MRVKRFEDLLVWQKAQDLAVEIYKIYQSNHDYGFKDQICRAAVSVSNNISEGFDRGTDVDFARFLRFSRTSGNEVKSMSYLAHRIGYTTEVQKEDFISRTEEISRMLNALIRSLNC